MELTQKMDNILNAIQEFLERMKTRSRDADKSDFRNVVSVSMGTKLNCETKDKYWVANEMNVSMSTRFDDDELNKAVAIEQLEAILRPNLETFEKAYNKKYNCGTTPVHRRVPTKGQP